MRSILCKPPQRTFTQPKKYYSSVKPNGVNRQVKFQPSKVSLNDVSYFVGKEIMLFTMFFCSLNWLHYRNLRKQHEERDEQDRK